MIRIMTTVTPVIRIPMATVTLVTITPLYAPPCLVGPWPPRSVWL